MLCVYSLIWSVSTHCIIWWELITKEEERTFLLLLSVRVRSWIVWKKCLFPAKNYSGLSYNSEQSSTVPGVVLWYFVHQMFSQLPQMLYQLHQMFSLLGSKDRSKPLLQSALHGAVALLGMAVVGHLIESQNCWCSTSSDCLLQTLCSKQGHIELCLDRFWVSPRMETLWAAFTRACPFWQNKNWLMAHPRQQSMHSPDPHIKKPSSRHQRKSQ